MKKLMTMTEFVKELTHNKDVRFETDKRLEKIITYCLLLKTPLSLSMFIPCGKDGEPMEKPIRPPDRSVHSDNLVSYDKAAKEYQKALESVLFEGFKYQTTLNRATTVAIVSIQDYVIMGKIKTGEWGSNGIGNIEELIRTLNKQGIELIPTEPCKKLIGI